MSLHRLALFASASCLAVATTAQAHFLFVYVGPPAEGGRTAEVFFSAMADVGDAKYVPRIALHTTLWSQAEPGRFQPLALNALPDRLEGRLATSGTVSVVGRCEYGVIARPNQTPFLLRYYPKAIAGEPSALNRLERQPAIPFEVLARADEKGIELTVVRDGKPVPKATCTIVNLDLEETVIEADSAGRATWTPQAPGRYSIYTRQDRKTKGELDGKAYDEVREFATLALDWPLTGRAADPEAVALFETALATRAQWADFPGFSARLSGSYSGRPFEGTVAVAPEGSVVVEADDPAAQSWARRQIESLVRHRLAEEHQVERPALFFATGSSAEDHPLGRLIVVDGGEFASSYRIRDGAITAVNRGMGRVNLTILTLDQQRNGEGKLLPSSYTVQAWNAETGALERVEAVHDAWDRVGAFDLPARHDVTTSASTGLDVRSLQLHDHRLGGKETR